MKKEIFYNGKKYLMHIEGLNGSYVIKIDNDSASKIACTSAIIPLDCLCDTDKFQKLVINLIENKFDLSLIEKWNGIVYNKD